MDACGGCDSQPWGIQSFCSHSQQYQKADILHIWTIQVYILDIWYDMIMIWYDMIWYDMYIFVYMIWYDMIWYDMIWYDMIWYDMICTSLCNVSAWSVSYQHGFLHMDLFLVFLLRLGTSVSSCCSLWLKLPWSWIAVGSWLCCCCRCSWEAADGHDGCIGLWSPMISHVFEEMVAMWIHANLSSRFPVACYSIQQEIGMMVITFVVTAGAILASTAYTVYKFDRMRRLAREIELQVEASYAEAKMLKDAPKMGTWLLNHNFSQDDLRTKGRFQALTLIWNTVTNYLVLSYIIISEDRCFIDTSHNSDRLWRLMWWAEGEFSAFLASCVTTLRQQTWIWLSAPHVPKPRILFDPRCFSHCFFPFFPVRCGFLHETTSWFYHVSCFSSWCVIARIRPRRSSYLRAKHCLPKFEMLSSHLPFPGFGEQPGTLNNNFLGNDLESSNWNNH